jgi:hypothetical protein
VFWLTTAAIAGAAGLYVLGLRGVMRRWLGGEAEDAAVA